MGVNESILNGFKSTIPFNLKHFTGEHPLPECGQVIGENVYLPTWDNKPPEVKPVLSLNGTPILTHQNTSMLIAPAGFGKSSICESIAANKLNPEADCLGLQLSDDCRGIISIDNERSNTDVWNSMYRITKRARLPERSPLDKIKLVGLRSVPRLDERKKAIEILLNNHPCSLLIIDGLGDLVYEANDEIQSREARIWLREITVKYDCSIFLTIHPNPGGNGKPRGHVGSEGLREMEAVLLVKNIDGDTRIITTEFEHGKNRNNGNATGAFRWSDEHGMFISADPDTIEIPKKGGGPAKVKAELAALKYLPAPTAKRYTELINLIMEKQDVAEATAKRLINTMVDYQFINKCTDGLYRAAL